MLRGLSRSITFDLWQIINATKAYEQEKFGAQNARYVTWFQQQDICIN